nr:aspartic and glutamic acid-rich protein-like [Cherax quadricarinatus]
MGSEIRELRTLPCGTPRLILSLSQQVAVQVKDADLTQKNPGNDSAVSVGSSDEDEANISKYFDYLNDDDPGSGSASKRKKKKKSQGKENQGNENQEKENQDDRKGKEKQENDKSSERPSRKGEYEKDMRHIERHLSMKKTIRKKMMRDLQQAFVEDPGEFQQDPNRMTPEKKNNIDIRNLTFSKSRLSKSEHNFLDMLKDESPKDKDKKDRKGILGYRDIMKNNKNKEPNDVIKDDDSGNGSPSRESPKKALSKEDLIETKDTPKDDKKIGFWKKLTGKGKIKR